MKGPLVIFTGLSMMTHEAERYAPPDADIRPPAQRGDIESAVQQYSNPGRIALFDGKFFQAEAISIIEIREAIERGWSVIGGASMGALRAIESAPLGMRGMGLVFRWMRRYRIADDDEVAQIMHPYSYKRLSDAMIDIRYALHQFNHMGLLTASEKTHICSRIKQRHFPDRHIDDIPQLLLGRGNAMRRDQMARCIKKGMPSVKTRDVKTILSHIRCYG